MLKINTNAPNFSLKSQDGVVKTLQDFAGSWLLLYFYPKDNTPGCTAEACSFKNNWQELEKRNCNVVGISADSVKSHQKFASFWSLPFTVLSDPTKETSNAYQALVEKSMFGKKYMGIARVSYLIDPKGKIAKTYPDVNPLFHTKEVLADLTFLQVQS